MRSSSSKRSSRSDSSSGDGESSGLEEYEMVRRTQMQEFVAHANVAVVPPSENEDRVLDQKRARLAKAIEPLQKVDENAILQGPCGDVEMKKWVPITT